MSVYFVYRSFDLGPTGKYLKRFDDDTVLDWFRSHWNDLAVKDREQADARLADLLGCDGWFLWNPFHSAVEEGIAQPNSDRALRNLLQQCLDDDALRFSPHCIQIFTEEDGEGGALYYFDDHFLNRYADRAAYLLCEGWQFPNAFGGGEFRSPVATTKLTSGSGQGTTYIVLLARESKYPLDDLEGGYRIGGIRLPQLAQHLCLAPSRAEDDRWPARLRQLPALLLGGVELVDPMDSVFLKSIQAMPRDAVNWVAWTDWRQEQGAEPPGISLLRAAFERLACIPGDLQEDLPQDDVEDSCRQLVELEQSHRHRLQTELRGVRHSLIHVGEHLAQMCLDVSGTTNPYFAQFIFFDDLWASANPNLANAVLRFAARWDVLSVR